MYVGMWELDSVVIPKRYLFASMFIAAMLMLLAIVQAPRPISEGGAAAASMSSLPLCMDGDGFETVAEYRLKEGWAPRFKGNLDPDHDKAWPYCGGFGAPWEPASAYLADRGLALNGPDGKSEVVICKGIGWRHYRFDYPITSARLDPINGDKLLVTLMIDDNNFETSLLELPGGQVIWNTCSGPWSRFSWDGQAAIFGLFQNTSKTIMLLSSIPVSQDIPELTMTLWDGRAPALQHKNSSIRQDSCLIDKSKKILGAHFVVPWRRGAKFWFPRKDCIWVSVGNFWTMWKMDGYRWHRVATGIGELYSQPPIAMGLMTYNKRLGIFTRLIGSLSQVRWDNVSVEDKQWPQYDPAWIWYSRSSATTAWDSQWGNPVFPEERQRDALVRTSRSEWITSSSLRASVRGWLPYGPEVALRESHEMAWVWVGHKVFMKKLQPNNRSMLIKKVLRG